MKNIKQKLIIASVIVVAILIAVFIYLSQKKIVTNTSTPIVITSSVPINGDSSVSVFNPITITFNQPVDPSSVTVISDPSENWTTSQVTPDTIVLDHNLYLRVATTYKLTILQHGNIVGTLGFETAQEQNDPRQLQNLQSQLDKNYPLASLTPYETTDYRVIYSAPLTIEIQLKGSMKTQDAITQVQAWVKSNGVNPTTHKYIVTGPSPTP
jgi:hypothetical protein